MVSGAPARHLSIQATFDYIDGMPRRGRSQLKDQIVFFVTTSTKGHEKLFADNRAKELLLDIIFERVAHFKGDLFGFVIMPNHIHLLVRIEGGGPKLANFMRDIKSLSARQLFPERKGIWQERFDDVAIYTLEQFTVKLSYIHNNPVKAGLVGEAEQYEYSSASDWKGESSNSIIKTEIF